MALNFPISPNNGDTYSVGGVTYAYNSTKGVWLISSGGNVQVSASPPANPSAGDVWIDDDGRYLTYFSDGDSFQWVEIAASSGNVLAYIATTTDSVQEGTNLYFTESRANTAIDNRVTKSFVDALDIDAATANTASNISVTVSSTNSNYRVPFLLTTATANGQYQVGVDSGIYYNPSLNFLSAGYFIGSISGQIGSFSNYVALTGDNDYVEWGTDDDVRMFYDGVNNTMELELKTDAQSFIITDNGNTKFTFFKSNGLFTANAITSLGDIVGGNVIPAANIIYDLGSPTNRFRDLYLSGSSIYLGNVTLKANAGSIVAEVDGTEAPLGGGTATGVSDKANESTGYFALPSGNTIQRPGSPTAGMFRFNNLNTQFEGYTGTAWVGMVTGSTGIYTIDYLVVGGGGSGGNSAGAGDGGGGAGGYIAVADYEVTSATQYNVVVGAGGSIRTNGQDSSAFGTTALGGGSGAAYFGAGAGSGGSGGGARGGGANDAGGGAGTGTVGQGNNGGAHYHVTGDDAQGGGGGGANAAGGSAGGGGGGAGGAGKTWLNGITYAGGGGGGSRARSQGAGGAGGGGNAGSAGLANSGGGGGAGGAGGSGVVIVRYAGGQRGNGGNVSSAGGYTYHTFTTSGTFIA